MDARWASAGDAWVCGVNCDNKRGYTITTPVLNTGFNINLSGNVNIPYGLITPAITVDSIRALTLEYLTIGDSMIITWYLLVSGIVNLGNVSTIRADGYNGTIRCVPLVDGSESSLTFYK